jgi:hypothetical protein
MCALRDPLPTTSGPDCGIPPLPAGHLRLSAETPGAAPTALRAFRCPARGTDLGGSKTRDLVAKGCERM